MKDNNERLIDSKYYSEQAKKYIETTEKIFEWLQTINTPFNWLFIVPPENMIFGERTGKYKINTDRITTQNNDYSMISYKDFAMVISQEIENPTYNKTIITAAY